jgi:hypothetical protein
MNVRRTALIITLTVVLGGGGASRALAHMRTTYDGVCVQLNGFPGLLQRMHFFVLGNCRIKRGTVSDCQDNGACTISSPSGNISGKCQQVQNVGCQCVPN